MLKNIKQFNGAKAITKSEQKTVIGGCPIKPECGYIINTPQGPVRKECGPNYYCASGVCKRIYQGPQ